MKFWLCWKNENAEDYSITFQVPLIVNQTFMWSGFSTDLFFFCVSFSTHINNKKIYLIFVKVKNIVQIKRSILQKLQLLQKIERVASLC